MFPAMSRRKLRWKRTGRGNLARRGSSGLLGVGSVEQSVDLFGTRLVELPGFDLSDQRSHAVALPAAGPLALARVTDLVRALDRERPQRRRYAEASTPCLCRELPAEFGRDRDTDRRGFPTRSWSSRHDRISFDSEMHYRVYRDVFVP